MIHSFILFHPNKTMKNLLFIVLLLGCLQTVIAQDYRLIYYVNVKKDAPRAYVDINLYKNNTFDYAYREDDIVLMSVESLESPPDTMQVKETPAMQKGINLTKGAWVMTSHSVILSFKDGTKKRFAKAMLDKNMLRLQDKDLIYYLVKE